MACKTLPSLAPTHVNFLSSNHSTSYAGRWSTSGSRGQRTFLYLHKNTIEGTEKIEGQTNNTNKLGVNQEQRKVCNSLHSRCMCGLSLAWVTSENSTMLLESDSSWLTFAGPYPMLPRLSAPVSGVDCPSVDPRQPLCSPLSVHRQLPSLLSVDPRQPLLFASLLSSRNCPLCSPAANCPLLGRVVNSSSGSPVNCLSRVPFPLPDTARFHVQESFVWFRAKTDSSALAAYPHSATGISTLF